MQEKCLQEQLLDLTPRQRWQRDHWQARICSRAKFGRSGRESAVRVHYSTPRREVLEFQRKYHK
jgi:hypothetical protein